MPSRPPTKRGTKKLSDVARHLVLPKRIASTGYPAVRDQCRRMGIVHDEWQAGLGRAVLAKREDGIYAAGIGGILISICRQVGKTFTFGSIIFALCILFPGMKVLWTAHRTRTSNETFRSMKGMAGRKLIAPHIAHVRSVNGEQEIEFRNGSRILFGARESGFGRGFDDVDVVVFDEAQILTQKALDDMVSSTNVAPNPLIIYIGTPPKPTDPSEVFTGRRAEALAGETEDMLFLEISADPDAKITDRAQWAKANPSYPHRVGDAAMLRQLKNLGEASFRREALGIWDEVGGISVVEPEDWKETGDDASEIVADRAFALDVTNDRSSAAVAQCGPNARGELHIEVAKHHDGPHWVVPWLVEMFQRNTKAPRRVYVVPGGQAEAMKAAIEEADIEVVVLKRGEYAAGCAAVYDGIVGRTVWHRKNGQVPLDIAIAGAAWSAGDARVWDRRKSTTDISPLVAVTAALWGWRLEQQEPDYDVLDSIA